MRIVTSSDLWISVYYDFLGVLTWHGAARYCSPWHARCAGKTDGVSTFNKLVSLIALMTSDS